MPNNLTPDIGTDFYMFKPIGDTSEDESLESAILETIPTGIRPTEIKNFGALITNIPNLDLINENHGTQGVTPNNMGQLRGYPMPTITMNYEIETVGVDPNEITQALRCRPTLNNIVGYPVSVFFTAGDDVTETESGVAPTLSAHFDFLYNGNPSTGIGADWWTFNAGSTVPDSSKIPITTKVGVDYYYLNYIFRSDATYHTITVNIEEPPQVATGWTLGDSSPTYVDNYQTDAYPLHDDYRHIYYTAPVTITLLTDFYKTTVSGCGQNPATVLNVYSRNYTEVTVGDTLYSDAAATIPITDSYGSTNVVPAIAYDWFTVSSGVVGSFNSCP